MEYLAYVLTALIVISLLVLITPLIHHYRRKPPYKYRPILTKNEYAFWKVFQPMAAKRNLLICPKVRMEDFLSVDTKDKRKRQSMRGKIKSRHIDFILCDADMNMLAGVELDDASHKYNKNTIEADAFKNRVFSAIGMPLFRIIVTEENYPSQLEKVFSTIGK